MLYAFATFVGLLSPLSSAPKMSKFLAIALPFIAGGTLLAGCQSSQPPQKHIQVKDTANATNSDQYAAGPTSARSVLRADSEETNPGYRNGSAVNSTGLNASTAGGARPGRFISLTSIENKHLNLKTEVLDARDVTLSLKLSGHVEADTNGEVDISSRISGRLTKIFVKPGEKISRGQLMAMIDSRDVAELEGEMLEAKSKLDVASAHAERERSVYEEQIARPQALLDARSKADHAKVKLDLAQSEFHRIEDLYKEKIARRQRFPVSQSASS